MPISILMPALSPTMTEGNLVKWHKNKGDAIKAGDVLAEIETDKATMEVEAVDEGILGAVLVEAGTQGVLVNTLMGVLLEEGEEESSLESFLSGTIGKVTSSTLPQAPSNDHHPSAMHHALPSSHPSPAMAEERIVASPLAKRLAKEHSVSLGQVKGSGPRGRIVKQDVLSALEKGVVHASVQARTFSAPDGVFSGFEPPYQEVPVSMMRKVIARRLSESKQQVPHFYLSTEVRIDALLAARQMLNVDRDSKISVNDMVIQVTARALKAHPEVNAAWAGDTVRIFEHVDLAVAVSLQEGLITPIIRHADQKSLKDISLEMKELAARARAGKLKPEEFQGGTFSLSNLGMFGVDQFNAIINPPQAAILAVGAGTQKPVVKEGKLEIATCMTLTLSVDHRAIDGSVGAQFLNTLKHFLEQPVRML